MHSRPHTRPIARPRYRCRRCGAPATYQRKGGRTAGNKHHDLCGPCWQVVSAEGEAQGRLLLTNTKETT